MLYGSHQSGPGARFAPLLIFNAGGIEGVKQTFKVSLAQVKLKSLASGAAGVSANISGLSVPGDNSFTSVGVGGVLDLGSDAFQVDLNFMGFGVINGAVVVEGSLDGMSFNPLGNFSSSLASPSLLGGGADIEFSPIVCSDRIRYVRLNVQGSASSGFVVTVGGAVNEGGGIGGAGTLAATYDAGSSQADQTMTISDAKGGMVIFDASEGGFSGTELLQVLVPGGTGAGFLVGGGMEMGPYGILIQQVGWGPSTAMNDGIAIGGAAVADGEEVSIAIGTQSQSHGFESVAVGFNATAQADASAVFGPGATGTGNNSVAVGCSANTGGDNGIAVGFNALTQDGDDNIAIGHGAQAVLGVDNIVIGTGANTNSYGSSQRCVVIGFEASMSPAMAQVSSIAIGDNATACDSNGVAMGAQAIASGGSGNVAVGFYASVADGGGSTSMGEHAHAEGYYSVAVGWYSSASPFDLVYKTGAIAIGEEAKVIGANSIALGRKTRAHNPDGVNPADNAIVVGSSSKAYNERDIVVGWMTNSDATTGGTDAILIGNLSASAGTGCIVLGSHGISYPAVSVAGDNGIAIGTEALVSAAEGMAMGPGAEAGLFDIAIGVSASCTLPDIWGGGQGIAIGRMASVFMSNSIGIGYNSRTGELSEQNVVIGANSFVGDEDVHSNNILMGISVTAICDTSVVIGGSSIIGDVTVVSSASVAVGPSSSCFGNYDVALGSGAAVGANLPVVAAFDYGTALGCNSFVSGDYGLAIGVSASVSGDNGIAIGANASAGAGEIVFSSVLAGGANKFEVVGSTAGNPDLFKLDVSAMALALDSSMFLLYKDSGGNVVCNQVKVSPVTGYLSVPV